MSGRRLAGTLPPGDTRTLMVAMFCGAIGRGSYGASSIVFFTRSVGLSASDIGLGLSLAALVGLLASIAFGHVVDVFGAKRTTIIAGLVEAGCFCLAMLVHSFAVFIPVIVALGTTIQAGSVASAALVAALFDDAERVRILALLRSANNVAYTIGTLAAGVALSVDTRPAYIGLIAFCAGCSAVSALAIVPVKARRSGGLELGGPRSALLAVRDLPYLGVALVATLLDLWDLALGIAVPLWVITQTTLPKGVAAWLIGLNTVLVVVLQVRVARNATSISAARALQRRTGVLLAMASLAFALSGSTPGYWALPVLAGAVVLLTGGELCAASAAWLLRYRLADPRAQGRYAGAFQLAQSGRDIVAPIMLTTLIADLHALGWVLLAGLALAVGWVAGPATRLAERTRPAVVEAHGQLGESQAKVAEGVVL